MFKIRLYDPQQPSDLANMYRICLLTADNGGDASHLYSHPEMIGDFFAAPYCELEPTLAFVLEDSQGVCGYIIGALDTATFNQTMNTTWLPKIRKKYPVSTTPETLSSSEQWLSNLIHTDLELDEDVADYPSHLHIDLLPRAQKQGQGKALMLALWQALKKAGSPAVHLGVSRQNTNAVGFYKTIGFKTIQTYDTVFMMGKKL